MIRSAAPWSRMKRGSLIARDSTSPSLRQSNPPQHRRAALSVRLPAAMPDRLAQIIALILDRPMCEACLGAKAGLSAPDLEATLGVVRSTLQVHMARDRCRVCWDLKTVVFLSRPTTAG
jgi:hypothetical protein